MRIAYFDCSFGASGDMLLGACLDAGEALGFDLQELTTQLALLGLPPAEFSLSLEKVHRAGILASHLNVYLQESVLYADSGASDLGLASGFSVSSGREHDCKNGHEHEHEHQHEHEHDHEHKHEHEHEHEHDHEHEHEHEHEHDHNHSHDHNHYHDHEHAHKHEHQQKGAQNPQGAPRPSQLVEASHGRRLSDILALIDNSQLPDKVKGLASRIFINLGEAESKVHGVPIQSIHFHEVGATDSIVDIVGFAIAFHSLGIEKAVVSPLPLGSGVIRSAHGIYPVPGPATLNLIMKAGVPTRDYPSGYECLTPTGAAILTTIAERYSGPPTFERVLGIGYGAGTYAPAAHPNVVRLMVGSAVPQSPGILSDSVAGRASFRSEIICCLDTNIDDCSPQILAFAAEKLLEAGALDVALSPCLMKKGRSGHFLKVLARPEDVCSLSDILLSETTAIGVRTYYTERLVADRDFISVSLLGQEVRVKASYRLDGSLINLQPEYSDCVSLAERCGLPLKQVMQDCLETAMARLKTKSNS